MKKRLLLISIIISATTYSQTTATKIIEKMITKVADTMEGQNGRWQFLVKDRMLICITDENNNRMRIMAPITAIENLDEDELLNALTANFHTALDVKYAISDAVLWSVFIHPLAQLNENQIEDAIIQVYNAAETFGTLYTSTTLSFPASTPVKETKKKVGLQKG